MPSPSLRFEVCTLPLWRVARYCALVPLDVLGLLLRDVFGFDQYRPHQGPICRHLAAGRSALVVLPTGGGKSLCYQLPGLALGGSTLVISPLVALMRQQASKLKSLGVRAAAVHSGQEMRELKEILAAYGKGELRFLFLAPERLATPAVRQLLAQRPPTLMVIDEAHCVSTWGSGFRPDYARLGERLGQISPACPRVALTASATVTMQEEIIDRLGMQAAQRFVHGFRRNNLRLSVIRLAPTHRARAIAEQLNAPENLPAIIYCPTRRRADALASQLKKIGARSFHAGLGDARRAALWRDFSEGKLPVLVATSALSMGMDVDGVRTVIHAAPPHSLEDYYQEVGRAGRDGEAARCILYHSPADERYQRQLLQRALPTLAELKKLWSAIERGQATSSAGPQAKALIGLGAATVTHGRLCATGSGSAWTRRYHDAQWQRHDQFKRLFDFLRSERCRMQLLVEHFGDQQDSGYPCGKCDVCMPAAAAASFQAASHEDRHSLQALLTSLQERDHRMVGSLARAALGSILPAEVARLLNALERAGLVIFTLETHHKDERSWSFRRVHLTTRGRSKRALSHTAVQLPPQPDATQLSLLTSRTQARGLAPTEPTNATMRKASLAVPPHFCAEDRELFTVLREWRRRESEVRRLPAPQILSNRVLLQIIDKKPTTPEELTTLGPLGTRWRKSYGEAVLALLFAVVGTRRSWKRDSA